MTARDGYSQAVVASSRASQGASPSRYPHCLDPRSADADFGERILKGAYVFAGHNVSEARSGNRVVSPWALSPPDAAWTREAHGFDWLRHLLATGKPGRKRARALLGGWLRRPRQALPAQAWEAETAATRILNWLDHMDGFRMAGSEPLFEQFLESLDEHRKRLRRARPDEGLARLTASAACARLTLLLDKDGVSRAMARVMEDAERLMRDTGGLPRRRADLGLRTQRTLMALVQSAQSQGLGLEEELGAFAQSFATVSASMLLGPGRFAGLQGSARRPEPMPVVERAPAPPLISGYRRLQDGPTALLMDTTGEGLANAPLAIEASHGGRPFIVSCGCPDDAPAGWRSALAGPDAWSTLALEAGWPERTGTGVVRQHSREGVQSLTADHKGYAALVGLVHSRSLSLSPGGMGLEGEDVLLTAAPDQAPQSEAVRFCVRFHLHPDVRSSLSRDGQSVLLALKGQPGGRFRVDGARPKLDESVMIDGGRVRATRQIVLDGWIPRGHEGLVRGRISWSLRWGDQ